MEWSVEVYTDATGNAPVRDFLRRLPAKDSAKVAWVIRLLAEYGIELHMPHARHLDCSFASFM